MATTTRDSILQTIRSRNRCTVKDLAQATGVSPVSVRHHLNSLLADGLIAVEEQRQGVGRPLHVYTLTESALELFPSRYFRLTNRLLAEIKETLPQGKVEELLSGVAASMAEELAGRLAGMPTDEALVQLAKFLEDEGFEAKLERQGDRVYIREIGCPYLRVGQEHPEVCVVDQSFIATALSLPVERVTCVLDGDVHCTYTVDLETPLREVTTLE